MQILFADQLGSHFTLDGESQVILEVTSQFRKRRYHRAKAHLILSGIRHRAAAGAELIAVDSYRDFQPPRGTKVVAPSSRPMRALVQHWGIEPEPARGFSCSQAEFTDWVQNRGQRLLMEDFYRWQRTRLGVLMDPAAAGHKPLGGRWNFDAENRLPPPKRAELGVVEPWWPLEDEIDERVRWDLDQLTKQGIEFVGQHAPRKFAVTEDEAAAAIEHFLSFRLNTFGPYEDSMMSADWTMSHSLLSVPLNLGVIEPVSLARAAETRLEQGAPLASVEAFVRQVIGWRDYVWHLYWLFGEEYLDANALNAHQPLPEAWTELDSSTVEAACVSTSLRDLAQFGWLHHIQRLMILANQATQRGYTPKSANDWFTDAFVDGTPWVMPANVIGMGLYADGGRMSTKPYVSGGAYISKMSNYCAGCPFDPKKRVGDDACPFTAGYWAFLHKNSDVLKANHRMFQAMAGLKRLQGLEELLRQENGRERY